MKNLFLTFCFVIAAHVVTVAATWAETDLTNGLMAFECDEGEKTYSFILMEDDGAWSVANTETAVEKISEDTFSIVTGRENFHTYLRQVETNQWELANLDAGKYTITECRELPKLLEVIAQAIAPKVTTNASKKLREVKAELATLKEEINNAKIAKTIISGLYSETDLHMTSSEKA